MPPRSASPHGPALDPALETPFEPGFRSLVHVNEKGGRFGGTEEYIDLLTAALAARGVRSSLVCGVVVGELPPTMTTTVVDGLAAPRPPSSTAAAVGRAVAAQCADVVYLHNLFDATVVAELAARPRRHALIWYVHDHYLTCLTELRWRRDHGVCREQLGSGCLTAIGAGQCVRRHDDRDLGSTDLAHRRALSSSLQLVDAVIVVSDYMRGMILDAQPRLADRVHHVQRPIRDLGPAPVRRRTAADPAVVAFAGRITPEKGLAVLIDALAGLESSAPIELQIAGVVEHAAYQERCGRLERIARARNPHLQVTWLGHLNYPQTDALLRRSDIVAVPSQWPEPLGTIAIEAMAAGAAVIVSAIGGLEGSVDHGVNGLVVPPRDVAAWSRAISGALNDPDGSARLGRRASRRPTEDHIETLDRIVAGVPTRRRRELPPVLL